MSIAKTSFKRGRIAPLVEFAVRTSRSRRMLILCLATWSLPGCQPEPGFEVSTARFESEPYGFSVSYPDTMDTRENVPERISIGFSAGDGFDPRVELAIASDSSMSYETLVKSAARDSCLADSPGVTVQCTEIESRGTIRADSRRQGEVLYLTIQMTEVAGGRVLESTRRGPYVAFDLSSRTGVPTVLFVRAPMTRQLGETDVDLVLNVARSLRIED